MTKTHRLNISQYYSIFKKIQSTPSILSGSDQLTKYIIAKALAKGIQNAGDLESMLISLEKKSAYRYFTQSDFLFTNIFNEEVDIDFESDVPQTFSDTKHVLTDSSPVTGKRHHLMQVYSFLKSRKRKRNHAKLLRCLWISIC